MIFSSLECSVPTYFPSKPLQSPPHLVNIKRSTTVRSSQGGWGAAQRMLRKGADKGYGRTCRMQPPSQLSSEVWIHQGWNEPTSSPKLHLCSSLTKLILHAPGCNFAGPLSAGPVNLAGPVKSGNAPNKACFNLLCRFLVLNTNSNLTTITTEKLRLGCPQGISESSYSPWLQVST